MNDYIYIMYMSSDKEIGEKHQVGEKDEGETKKSKQKSRKEQQEQEKQNNYAEGFPENLVIYISLHGSIVIKDERNLEPIEIPDSIEYISKFNIAPPGDEAVLSVRDVIDLSTKSTCIHDEKDIQIYDKIIHKHIEDSDLDTTHDLPTLNRFMCQLQDELKTNYIGNFSKAEIHKPYKYNLEKGRGCKLHTFEKKSSSSSVASAASLDSSPDPPDIFHHLTPPHGKKTMLNKELSTELMISDEPLIGIIVANHRIRNYDILPDILRSLGLPTRSSIRLSPTPLRVTTKQILDFIANIRIDGVPVVKRLFIIDLSCQKFQRPYHELSGLSEQDRQILEAYVNERGYGGGKYKQLKKSRRNKKRKTRKTRKNK